MKTVPQGATQCKAKQPQHIDDTPNQRMSANTKPLDTRDSFPWGEWTLHE